jgi:hypothetical protein
MAVMSSFNITAHRNPNGVNSAFIIAAWIADVWVQPVKSHGCASPTNLSSAGLAINQPPSHQGKKGNSKTWCLRALV